MVIERIKLALRCRVGHQHRLLCSDRIHVGLMLIRTQDKALNVHGLIASYKDGDSVLCCLTTTRAAWLFGGRKASPVR